MLAARLKGYPLLEERSFPALAAEDYGNYIKPADKEMLFNPAELQ